MLIRFVVNNHLSFGQERELNLFPSPRYSRLGHHKYQINDFNLLKISAIYGANGAGKSNLIKSITTLVDIVKTGNLPAQLSNEKFKLSKDKGNSNQIFGIEFFKSGIAFYYAIEIDNGKVVNEELYKSGLGKKEDDPIFIRKTENGLIKISFNSTFDNEMENIALKNVIEKTLSKPNKSIFKLLNELENPFFKEIKTAFNWFHTNIQIITPDSKPGALAQQLDKNKSFKEFANKILCAFDVGIHDLGTEKVPLKEFFGQDDSQQFEKLSKNLTENKSLVYGLLSDKGEEVVAVYEDGEVCAKRLVLNHQAEEDKQVKFYLNEESDGTNRLLDYIPVFHGLMARDKVYIIDEIERSIHPLLIKELLTKFSLDTQTKGQLVFTTHESNLLDQDILRQDEIWFVEKDKFGYSDIYPLSEFKEHHTKDIKKGYLNGRYGAIPFLGNLKDLKWTEYANIE